MSRYRPRAIWISWESHRRTREICRYLELPLHELVCHGAGRYPRLLLRTTRCLLRERPRILLVQNPSIVLTCYATLLRAVFRYRLVIDAHNEAVEPHNHRNAVVRRIARFLLAAADFTIVTNQYVADVVRAEGGRPIVLPDRLPPIPATTAEHSAHEGNRVPVAVLIATYAKDEPIAEIIDAASAMNGQLELLVTGDPTRFLAARSTPIPANVRFTGFLDESNYWRMLRASSVIIDLTLKDNCLVCGAYEGVSVGVPLVLSNNRATRDYFRKGVVYTNPTPDSIRAALAEALERRRELAREVAELKCDLEGRWPQFASQLSAAIDA